MECRINLISNAYSFFFSFVIEFILSCISKSNGYAVLCKVTLVDQTVYEAQAVRYDLDKDIVVLSIQAPQDKLRQTCACFGRMASATVSFVASRTATSSSSKHLPPAPPTTMSVCMNTPYHGPPLPPPCSVAWCLLLVHSKMRGRSGSLLFLIFMLHTYRSTPS